MTKTNEMKTVTGTSFNATLTVVRELVAVEREYDWQTLCSDEYHSETSCTVHICGTIVKGQFKTDKWNVPSNAPSGTYAAMGNSKLTLCINKDTYDTYQSIMDSMIEAEESKPEVKNYLDAVAESMEMDNLYDTHLKSVSNMMVD